jgi:CRISPR-associated protein Cmr2
MSNRYFHFTLGPVQSFVAQARRTRDFWAGSFLLSWLSAVAIKAVEAQDGDVSFPIPEKNYMAWLTNSEYKEVVKREPAPQQGCIPNRFKGLIAKVPENFNPQQVVESVQKAWEALADEVWENDLGFLCPDDSKTRAIWARQVKDFWEISWALTHNENESNLLDRRKNWRSYLPPEEAGVKCMMMDGWQELSGIHTPNEKGLANFWEDLRNKKTDGTLKTDLREKEYLCAIAFIKRRFARVFHNLQKIDMQNGKWELYGWKVNPAVPSVSYMAAAPWLAKVLEKAPNETVLIDFLKKAKKVTEGYGEYDTKLRCIRNVICNRDEKLFSSLDGQVFFKFILENLSKKLEKEKKHTERKQVEDTLKALKKLCDSIPNLEVVSPFYAVLMMDGDSLGIQMSEPDKQKAISESLNYFTSGVNPIVEKHSGFLIYAGGDDVLALLPLEYALNCAYQLRELYLESFEKNGNYTKKDGTKNCVKSTLSGAIEYAHIKMPLGKVLGDAHHLLDDVAKDGSGRDSIAVRVWKPGGQHLQWAMPWEKAVKDSKVIINTIANQFADTEEKTPFSNSFFFNIEERFAMLERFSEENIIQLIAAEYLNSGVNEKFKLAHAIEQVTPLIKQCMPIRRDTEHGIESFYFPLNVKQLDINAAHFVRFLVTKGVE